ncbi:MAG: recombinase family protein [Candidatus Microsaccharimonas sp.]
MKKIAVYMRVSTAGQEEEQTIENQRMELLVRIEKDFPGHILEPDLTYVDDGWSGSILQRPGLDALRADAHEGKFDILYAFDRGRLSRIFYHQEIVLYELRELGIKFIGLYDINGETNEERLMGSVMGIFHEYERLKTAERMRIGKLRKVRESKKLLGYQPKYGYDYLPRIKKGENARDGEFRVNNKQAKNVATIFDWCADGKSIYGIRKELFDNGIMPPKGKNTKWSTSVIRRLLTDTTYMGVHYYNKSESIITKNPRKIEQYKRNPKGSRKARPKDEWLPVAVPVIISPQLFNTVQAQLERNKRTYDRKNGRTHQYLVGGLVYCVCGQGRVGDPAGNHSYYRCKDRQNNRLGTRTCKLGGVNTAVLDMLIWNNIKKLIADPALVLHYANKWRTGESPLQPRLDKLNEQLLELDEKEKRAAKVFTEGLMSKPIYEENVYDIDQRRTAMGIEIKAINDEIANKPLLPLEQLVEGVLKLTETLDFLDKKEIIQKVVSKVIATSQEVTVFGHIPVLADGDLNQNEIEKNPDFPTQSKNSEQRSEIGLNVKHRHRRPSKRWQIYPIQCPDRQ